MTSIARSVLAGALTLGLLAGCDTKGAAPDPTPVFAPSPSPVPTYTVGGKNYSITFPGRPKHSQERAKRGLRLTTDVFTLRAPDANFSMSRVSYAGHPSPSLRAALSSAASQTRGRLVSTRTYTYRGQPAIEGTIVGALASDREARVTIRYFLVDKQVLIGLIYVPNVKQTAKTKQVRDAFLESLRFTSPPKSAPGATESTDSGDTGPLPG